MSEPYKTDLEIVERVRKLQWKAGQLDLIFRDGNEQALFNALRHIFRESDAALERLNRMKFDK